MFRRDLFVDGIESWNRGNVEMWRGRQFALGYPTLPYFLCRIYSKSFLPRLSHMPTKSYTHTLSDEGDLSASRPIGKRAGATTLLGREALHRHHSVL